MGTGDWAVQTRLVASAACSSSPAELSTPAAAAATPPCCPFLLCSLAKCLILQIQAMLAAAGGGDWPLHLALRHLKHGPEVYSDRLQCCCATAAISLVSALLAWLTTDLCVCACAALSPGPLIARWGHKQGSGLVPVGTGVQRCAETPSASCVHSRQLPSTAQCQGNYKGNYCSWLFLQGCNVSWKPPSHTEHWSQADGLLQLAWGGC